VSQSKNSGSFHSRLQSSGSSGSAPGTGGGGSSGSPTAVWKRSLSRWCREYNPIVYSPYTHGVQPVHTSPHRSLPDRSKKKPILGSDSPFFLFFQAGFLKMQPLFCRTERFADGSRQAGTATFCPMEMGAGILQVARGVWEGVKSGVLDLAWTGRDLSGRRGMYRDVGSDLPVSGSDCLFFWFFQAGFPEMRPRLGVFSEYIDGNWQAGTAMFCWRKRQGAG